MHMNTIDKQLHDKIHESMLEMDPKHLLDNPRLKVLDMLSDFDIAGHVADIGCGSGYFGIGVAKSFNSVNKVDCIEASRIAVESVIPRNIKYHDLSNKVVALEGSFDSLAPDTYNVIFAMGALHHSQNLNRTLQSIFKALKKGGLIVAQEPSMPDTTSHEAYSKKYNIVEERWGLRIRNGDRFDRFFRECEYKHALVTNGFNILLCENFKISGQKISMLNNLIQHIKTIGISKTLHKILSKLTKKMSRVDDHSKLPFWQIKMQQETKNLKQKLFVAEKSSFGEIYHHDC